MARLDFVVSTALQTSLKAARQKIVGRCVTVDGACVVAPSWQVRMAMNRRPQNTLKHPGATTNGLWTRPK
jgi:ribosomal protein S4